MQNEILLQLITMALVWNAGVVLIIGHAGVISKEAMLLAGDKPLR